ncbi:MAG: siroheme synthase CysG [Marinicella sp.]
MNYLPINIDLKNQPVLVFGAGEVAVRKIKLLLKAGAKITCIGLKISGDIIELGKHQSIQIKVSDLSQSKHPYLNGAYISQFRLVVSATDNHALSERIYQVCQQNHVLINTVDDKARCNYITPAIIDRDPLIISVSSSGAAPVLVKRIKTMLETDLPHRLGQLAQKADSLRASVKKVFTKFSQRKRFWESFFSSSHASDILQGRSSEDNDTIIKQFQSNKTPQGEVALVGAGPGDPELLTVKALQCLQKADVVLYDRLVSPEIIELIRKDATLIPVGKSAGHHSVPQEQINQWLVDHAKQGKQVVRLKGGDPFVFGRGGEELQTLKQHQIKFQIVPGITAAVGCSAYAGIPLTHRDFAQNVLFVTGHCKDSIDTYDWPSLAREQQTIAVYMGLMKSAHLSEQLIKHGKSPETPVALIENGTSVQQRVFTTILSDLSQTIDQHKVSSPTLIVIGEVAALANELAWFDPNSVNHSQPLELLTKTA